MTDAVHEALRRGADADITDSYTALSAALWRERECLEQILFKLVGQQLLLATGNTRWLHLADQEVHVAAEALRDVESSRSAALADIAAATRLPFDVTLADLVAQTPEPWSTILAEHLAELRLLAADISAATVENERLLCAGEDAVRTAVEPVSSLVPVDEGD